MSWLGGMAQAVTEPILVPGDWDAGPQSATNVARHFDSSRFVSLGLISSVVKPGSLHVGGAAPGTRFSTPTPPPTWLSQGVPSYGGSSLAPEGCLPPKHRCHRACPAPAHPALPVPSQRGCRRQPGREAQPRPRLEAEALQLAVTASSHSTRSGLPGPQCAVMRH